MSIEHSPIRWGRIPTAENRSGLKRGALYKLAGKHRGLFKKAGAATIVDLQLLDEIIASLPDAEVTESDPATGNSNFGFPETA
jgi:hypothetical protein